MNLDLSVSGLCALAFIDRQNTLGNKKTYRRVVSLLLSGKPSSALAHDSTTRTTQAHHGGPEPSAPSSLHYPYLCIPAQHITPPYEADRILAIEHAVGRTELAVWDVTGFDVSLIDASISGRVETLWEAADPNNPNWDSMEFVAQPRRASGEAAAAMINPALLGSDPDENLVLSRVFFDRGVLACRKPKNEDQKFDLNNYPREQQFVEAVVCRMAGVNESIVHLAGFGKRRGEHKYVRLKTGANRTDPVATVCNLPDQIGLPSQAGEPLLHFDHHYDTYLPQVHERELPSPALFVDPVYCLMSAIGEV